MNRKRLIALILLLTAAGNPAVAAENPEHESKNARKVLTVLASVGVNDPEVKSFIGGVDKYIEDGHLMLSKHRVANGTLVLHYELSADHMGSKQLELRYTPDNSNWVGTARPNEVMLRYSYKF